MGRRKSNDAALKLVLAIIAAVLLSPKAKLAVFGVLTLSSIIFIAKNDHSSGPAPTFATTSMTSTPRVAASTTALNSPQVAEAIPFKAAWVNAAVVNQRIKPNGTINGKLRLGTAVKIYDEANGWARISPVDQNPVWVSKSLLCYSSGCAQPASKHNAPETGANSRSSQSSVEARATASATRRTEGIVSSTCWCSSSKVCVGPRGGIYCITSGGKKRYLPR
jgi:SH3-like domain-containing protein